MLPQIKQFSIFGILLLLGCAAQGPATGGPVDKKGPSIISIQPENGSLNIHTDQKIVLIFDELLDPVSIPASIHMDGEHEYKLKIRGRKIIIFPEDTWPEKGIVRINLSRKIRDYQKNMMSVPIQLIFSTGSEIPMGIIKGEIINTDNENLIEVGLYNWPPSSEDTYLQKVEVDKNGLFQFNAIEDGRYTIIALEGVLDEFGKQIRKKKYAMTTSNFFSVPSEDKNIVMLLSDPLEKLKITSVEMKSQYYSQVTLDDNSTETILIDSVLIPGDSVSVSLNKSNRLEAYQVPEFTFILPEVFDTLAPQISQSYFEDNLFTLKFSEPVSLDSNALIFESDTTTYPLPFNFENAYSVSIPHLPDSIQKIYALGEYIHDWAGNQFEDSSKTIRINRKKIDDEFIIGGNILGFVEYEGKHPLKIEANNIERNTHYITDVINDKFEFSNLSTGLYNLWGFEALNTINKEIYHSGQWEPYQRAAKFTHYPDTIDVRARWDVEGVFINFK